MIMQRFSPLLILLTCVITLNLSAAHGAEDRKVEILAMLKERFSSIKTVKSDFIQKNKLKVFNRVIMLKGRLSLESPSRLAWRVDSPR